MKHLHIIISRNEKKSGQEKTAEKSWTVGVQLQRTIIRLLFVSWPQREVQQQPAAGAGALTTQQRSQHRGEIMSSSLSSGISASPSAAASTARRRHDAAPQQLTRVKAAARPQLLHAGRRRSSVGRRPGGGAVVVRAGPGPLSEIEPDLEEDAIDVYRTNGISPVRRRRRPSFLLPSSSSLLDCRSALS